MKNVRARDLFKMSKKKKKELKKVIEILEEKFKKEEWLIEAASDEGAEGWPNGKIYETNG